MPTESTKSIFGKINDIHTFFVYYDATIQAEEDEGRDMFKYKEAMVEIDYHLTKLNQLVRTFPENEFTYQM